MAKVKSVFVCSECGYESPVYQGKCICGAWNSFFEQKIESDTKNQNKKTPNLEKYQKQPKKLDEITISNNIQVETGLEEFDNVVGGGLTEGSVTLITGEPGIGKSTLLLQIADSLSKKQSVLYVSGEESDSQIKARADRLDIAGGDLHLYTETNLEKILSYVEKSDHKLVIVDSIQTIWSESYDQLAGTVTQLKEVSLSFTKMAKELNISVILVAHVTKQGDLAGPKIIEHIVDTVLYFNGDRSFDIRILNAVKNRFGAVGQIGAFEMSDKGLSSISDLSLYLVSETEGENIGTIVSGEITGNKPILFEMQSLVSKASAGFARRIPVGISNSRLSTLIAIIENAFDVSFVEHDVYLNIAGGISPEGRGIDLPAIISIFSAVKKLNIKKNIMAIGEVSLRGEVRGLPKIDAIIREATRIGFKKIIVPSKSMNKIKKYDGIQIKGVATIADAIKECFN